MQELGGLGTGTCKVLSLNVFRAFLLGWRGALYGVTKAEVCPPYKPGSP